MLKTNQEQLVELAVAGEIAHPTVTAVPRVAYDGTPFVPVGHAGIAFNVKVGDNAFAWAGGDHLEPGVAVRHGRDDANAALLTYACIGNEATLLAAEMESKDAKLKGATGTVTGKHDGRLLIYFPKRTLDHLCIGDRIQVRACGVGLKLLDYPHVLMMNCGPQLLRALNISEKAGKVRVPVAKVIPGRLVGSGLGQANVYAGDYDIQTTSPELMRESAFDQLRLGDLVAITDHDCSHGPRWQPEAATVGVVVHGTSLRAGHGPGVCPLLTSGRKDAIEPIITRKANLVDLLGLV
ncbi:MAG: DUF4438 domain-containing protein [Planctomycetes bacterium]|nr:DUF4438 domain-containing protein [Planctomycetota bacterium]